DRGIPADTGHAGRQPRRDLCRALHGAGRSPPPRRGPRCFDGGILLQAVRLGDVRPCGRSGRADPWRGRLCFRLFHRTLLPRCAPVSNLRGNDADSATGDRPQHDPGGQELMSAQTGALLSSLPQRLSDIPPRWAALAPERVALAEGTVRFTYRQLADAVSHAAAQLRESGLRPGDRLMILAENCIAQVVLIFAAARIDAWAVNVNARLSDREVDAIREHS